MSAHGYHGHPCGVVFLMWNDKQEMLEHYCGLEHGHEQPHTCSVCGVQDQSQETDEG